jgi:hypothetical protein
MPYRLRSFEYEEIIKNLPPPTQHDWKLKGLDVVVAFLPDRERRFAVSKENRSPQVEHKVNVMQIRFTLNVKDRQIPFWECTEPVQIIEAEGRYLRDY